MTREEARKFKEERCTFLDYNGDFLPGSPVEHFILKASEKTFTGGVVRRTSLFGHWSCKFSVLHPLDPAWPTVMRTSIRMNNRMLAILKSSNGVIQHGIDKFGIRRSSYSPGRCIFLLWTFWLLLWSSLLPSYIFLWMLYFYHIIILPAFYFCRSLHRRHCVSLSANKPPRTYIAIDMKSFYASVTLIVNGGAHICFCVSA